MLSQNIIIINAIIVISMKSCQVLGWLLTFLCYTAMNFTKPSQTIIIHELIIVRNKSGGIVYENVSSPAQKPRYVNYKPSRFGTPQKSDSPAISSHYLTPMTKIAATPSSKQSELSKPPLRRDNAVRVSSFSLVDICLFTYIQWISLGILTIFAWVCQFCACETCLGRHTLRFIMIYVSQYRAILLSPEGHGIGFIYCIGMQRTSYRCMI